MEGRASRYDIRFAATSRSGATWDSAAVVASPPAPGSAGEPESLPVAGLDGSPDGSLIAFSSNRGGNDDIWVLYLES